MSAQPISRRRALSITPRAALRSLTIEWGVSRRALGELAPQGPSSLVTLRYQAGSGEVERLSLVDPQSKNQRGLPERVTGQCTIPQIRVAGERVHVQSPLLYAFVSIEHETPELLYARTPVHRMLGIMGGRYQPQGVRVVTD